MHDDTYLSAFRCHGVLTKKRAIEICHNPERIMAEVLELVRNRLTACQRDESTSDRAKERTNHDE